MKTLNLMAVGDDKILDRITLDDGGQVGYETGAGRDLIDNLVHSLEITPAQAFEMRTGWSNGYVSTKLA